MTQHLELRGCSGRGMSAPWTSRGRCCLARREAVASESCLGVSSEQGLYLTQAHRAETRSLEQGEPAVTDTASPALSLQPTAFHGLQCLPKWDPAKTGNYLTWGARELLSWYLQIKGEELKTVVRVQPNLITSRDFISSKKFWMENLCA